jgi:hypothetical protein
MLCPAELIRRGLFAAAHPVNELHAANHLGVARQVALILDSTGVQRLEDASCVCQRTDRSPLCE